MHVQVPPQIVNIVNELDPPVRKRRLTNEDALAAIYFMLRTGVPWRDVQIFTRNCSASAVYKRYRSWVASGVFEKVWKELVKHYSEQRIRSDANWFHDLFIDTTMIKNVGGVDGLGKNPTDRGRLATKMGAIVDSAGIPVAIEFFSANRNDVTTALDTVAAIGCPIRPEGWLGPDKRFKNTLVGDKGYVSKKLRDALKPSGIRMLTPNKKNSRCKKMHHDDRVRLRRRLKVENLFCRLDKFKKIHCRHEKSLAAFRALTYFACAMMFASPKMHDLMEWGERP
jgi:transposase